MSLSNAFKENALLTRIFGTKPIVYNCHNSKFSILKTSDQYETYNNFSLDGPHSENAMILEIVRPWAKQHAFEICILVPK